MTVAQMTRSRIALAVLAVFIPASGLACFDGDWYAINLQDGIAYLAIAGVALVCAAVVQMLSNRFVWYAPILVAAVTYALPVIELLRWGSGDCGVVFLSRSQLSVAVAGAFLAYESFRLHRIRRLSREYESTRVDIEELERKAAQREDRSND